MVTRSKVADMNYDNYDEKVVQKLKVKLVGWPFEKIISPTKLYTIGELRTLRDVLRSGACCWVQMSKLELKAHANDIAMRREGGEVIGKARKERSDKGVKTGPRRKPGACDESSDSDSDDGSSQLQSRKRKSAHADVTQAGPSKKRKEAEQRAGPSKKKRAPAKARAGKNSAKAQLPPSKETISSTDTDETEQEDV